MRRRCTDPDGKRENMRERKEKERVKENATARARATERERSGGGLPYSCDAAYPSSKTIFL